MKMNLGKKIAMGFVCMLILIGILGVNSLFTLYSFKDQLQSIDTANNRLTILNATNNSFKESVGAIRGFLAYGNENYIKQTETALENTLDLENELLGVARTEKIQTVKDLIKATTEYKDMLLDELPPLVRQRFMALDRGNIQEYYAIQNDIDEVVSRALPYTEQLTEIVNQLVEENTAIVTGEMEKAEANANRTTISTYIIIAFTFIVGILLSFFLTRMIRNPILTMVAIANTYAEGDLRESVKIKSKDELGYLGESLNKMRSNFVDIIKKIMNGSQQLNHSSQEISSSAEQSSQASNQIAESITQVARGAEQQLEAVSECSAIVEQLSAGIQQIAATAGSVSSSSDKTVQSAKEGQELINSVIQQMKNIENTVTGLEKVVGNLGERSKEIGQIVDTISGIAGQTNLLALNAAIEAARAGEQGRGFAVVADEVRKLAEQSQEAAKKIADLIGDIQQETDKVITSMNEGTREVKVGTEVVNKAGESFITIVGLIQGVSDQIREISASTQEMATGSQQMVSSIERINEISKSVAGQTQNVSAATEEAAAAMEEMAASAESLAAMSQNMEEVATIFKI